MPSAGSRTETSSRVGAFVLAPRYATCSVWEKKSSSISPSNVQSLRGRAGSGVLREEAGGRTWARLGLGGSAAEGAGGAKEQQHQGWGWHQPRGSSRAGAGTGPDTGSPQLSPSSSPPPPGRPSAWAEELGIFFLRHLHPPSPSGGGGGSVFGI